MGVALIPGSGATANAAEWRNFARPTHFTRRESYEYGLLNSIASPRFNQPSASAVFRHFGLGMLRAALITPKVRFEENWRPWRSRAGDEGRCLVGRIAALPLTKFQPPQLYTVKGLPWVRRRVAVGAEILPLDCMASRRYQSQRGCREQEPGNWGHSKTCFLEAGSQRRQDGVRPSCAGPKRKRSLGEPRDSHMRHRVYAIVHIP